MKRSKVIELTIADLRATLHNAEADVKDFRKRQAKLEKEFAVALDTVRLTLGEPALKALMKKLNVVYSYDAKSSEVKLPE